MEKARLDIEDLLVWAYRDQNIDRVTALSGARRSEEVMRCYGPGWGALQMLAEIGILVRTTGSSEPSSLSSAILEDAERIHAAVLGLGDMFIEADGDDVRIWDRAEEDAVGFVIRETARGYEVRRPDGFVRPVVRAVTTSLLVCHAKHATRPECYLDWSPGKPMRLDARGRLVLDHDAAEISPVEVSIARAEYHVWRAALMALAVTLENALEVFAVTGPRAPDAPWLARSKPSRVFEIGTMDEATHDKILKRRKNLAV
jgi:hypothetical protein